MIALCPFAALAFLQTTLGFLARATTCCDQLRTQVSSDKIFSPDTPSYHTENSAYWSSTCQLTPRCIFTPTSAADVSTAVKALVASNCEFAIRGGGHMPNPGWAGTSNGVLFSLSRLDSIEFGEGNRSVKFGPGNRWGRIYNETEKRGVVAAGGRMTPVGVSGFLLGGGISFMAHEKGFAADTILSYEIVLANGTIAYPSSTSSPDLFKALKGGSSNFGIVTSFTMETYSIEQIYAVDFLYSPAQYDALFPVVETYARTGTETTPKSHIIAAWVYRPGMSFEFATCYAFYSEPLASPPDGVKPFFDIPARINARNMTYKGLVEHLSVGNDNGVRYQTRVYSVRANAALFKGIYDIFKRENDKVKKVADWWSSLAFQPISNGMIRAGQARGGNAMGLETNSDPLIVVNYQFHWIAAEEDAIVYAMIDRLVKDSIDLARSQGKLADFQYLNYGSSDQSPIEKYGPNQVTFLQRVKQHYDPTGVFKRLVPGGFKVPDS